MRTIPRLIALVLFIVVVFSSCDLFDSKSPTGPSDTNAGSTSTQFAVGMVTISFDDGWRSTYNNVVPILDAAGIKTTHYIITGRFNQSEYIGVGEVLSLEIRGHEIGSHSKSHLDLSRMTEAQVRSEVIDSRNDLLNAGVRSVTTFAYPFGVHNSSIVSIVRENGLYDSARSTITGDNIPSGDKFLLSRRNLGGQVTIETVRGWIDAAVANKTWLIMLAHHVDSTVSEFSITPKLFRDIVDYLKEKNVKVVTISEGLRLML